MVTDKEIKFDNEKLASLLNGSVAKNARELGVSRQHLNNVLKGRRVPSGSLMLKIQRVFKLDSESISEEVALKS